MSIAGELDAVGQPAPQIVQERHSAVRIAAGDQPANQHLRVGAECRPGPGIARARRRGLSFANIVVLGVDERPDLIDLHPLARKVPQRAVLIGRAGVARIDQQLSHGVLAGACKPRHSAHGLPLTQQVEDLGAVFAGQLVHTQVI